MAVQSPCCGWGRGGSPDKEQAGILSPGFWDYLGSGVGRNRRGSAGDSFGVCGPSLEVGQQGSARVLAPGQAAAVSDGLCLGR